MNDGAGQSRTLWTVALALALGAAVVLALSPRGAGLEPGQRAPAFSLPDVATGEQRSLESWQGQWVLFDFWSTSCPPCLRQLEELETLRQLFPPQQVAIVGINTDGASLSGLQEFAQQRRLQYTVLADNGIVAQRYRVNVLPTLYLVDEEGQVRWSRVGYIPHQQLAQVIRESL
jgi:peroxiredoxin